MTHTIPPFESGEDQGYKFLRVFADYHLAREETIDIYVEGGVSPYDWETDSNHLTLGSDQTEGQSNTVTADDTAVADLEEIITVTDAEGSQVEIIVCVCDVDCCAGEPDEFEFDDDSTPDYVDADSCIDLYVTGGCLPITWEITETEGGDYSLTEEVTDVRQNELCVSGEPDCEIEITATDGCRTEISFNINGYPEFEFNDDDTANYIVPGGSINLYVAGGRGPYDWTVTDLGYTLDYAQTEGLVNVLNCASGTCGEDYDAIAHITVTDACGSEVKFNIINNQGHWSGWIIMDYIDYDEECGEYNCAYGGGGTTYYYPDPPCYGYGWKTVRTVGKVMLCFGSDPDSCCKNLALCGYDNSTPKYGFLCYAYVTYEHEVCGVFVAGPYAGEVHCHINIQMRYWTC